MGVLGVEPGSFATVASALFVLVWFFWAVFLSVALAVLELTL